MAKSYGLWIHWKQGDDFAAFLSEGGDVSKALNNWADFLQGGIEKIRKTGF